MSSSQYSDADVAEILRQADRMIGERLPVNEICRRLGISRSSFYRWQHRFGLRAPVSEMIRKKQRVEELEREVAERELEIASLRVAAEGN